MVRSVANLYRLNVVLSSVKAIHERYSAVLVLKSAVVEGEIEPLSGAIKQRLDWLGSKMDELLDKNQDVSNCPVLVPQDGKALMKILNESGKLGHYLER
jgi:hypothetical protein